jgi:hypothetical protein
MVRELKVYKNEESLFKRPIIHGPPLIQFALPLLIYTYYSTTATMKLHFALSLFTLAPIVWAADYLSTCSDCRLASSDPPNLSCACQSLDGSDRTTTINLNTCIINAGGILRQQRRLVVPDSSQRGPSRGSDSTPLCSGNFAGSCDSISYSANGDLKALCRNGVKDDSDNWITINLSTYFFPPTCCNHRLPFLV